MSGNVVLYKCLICDFATTSLQALRGHMNRHKDVEFENFTVRLPKDICRRFREVCRKRNTTTCHVIYSVLTSIVEGEKLGVVNIATHNPLVINLNTFIAAKPRGHGKYDFSDFEGIPLEPKCVLCGAPAIAEGVQYNGWRFGYCERHFWLRNWAPQGYEKKRG